MKSSKYEVVIVGSGVSGLYSALKISERPDFDGKILLITKAPLGESNSRYAQGGIACALQQNTEDSILLHIFDTLNSGAGLCKKEVVESIINNSEKVINDLVSLNAGFDCDINGKFECTLGGAHSAKRILHSGEDSTGMVMISALTDLVKKRHNIEILPRTMVVELLVTENNECNGLIILKKEAQEHEIIYSQNVVLSTGGAGQVYKYTTNPYGATGDGIALAYFAGLSIKDMEFIQFHPTSLVINDKIRNRYLISEALRGEGATLVNNNGKEFMSQYSDKKDLAPRDVVSRAIISEMIRENKPNVFLDATHLNPEIIKKRFPSITKKCFTNGIDITKKPIPVAPAAHYMIGGVEAQINGKTSIKGLYVIGELASTGFHGANRLASNSLLECVVSAYKLSGEMVILPCQNLQYDSRINDTIKMYSSESKNKGMDIQAIRTFIQDTMWEQAGIIRSETSLNSAQRKLEELQENFNCKRCNSFSEYECRNMLITANIITKSAVQRKRSIGAHYISDSK